MEWEQFSDGYWMSTVDNLPTADDMTEITRKIVVDVIPKHSNLEWDHLRVELWPDSGRVIVFPALDSNANRIDVAGCQIVFASLLSEYETLADSDMPDEEFDSVLQAEEQRWIDQLIAGARQGGLRDTRMAFWESGSKLLRDISI